MSNLLSCQLKGGCRVQIVASPTPMLVGKCGRIGHQLKSGKWSVLVGDVGEWHQSAWTACRAEDVTVIDEDEQERTGAG